MKKDNTLKIALTVTGIVLLVVLGIILFVWNIGRTVHNNKYKNIYCNGDCYYYDGKVIKYYESDFESMSFLEEPYSTEKCLYKSEGCKEILEYNKDYLIYQEEGDTYIYYKYPYVPEETNKGINIKNTFYTNGVDEVYIYDDETMVVAGRDFKQTKGEYYVNTIGYNRFYEAYLYVPDAYDTYDYSYPITSFVYDKKKKELVGFEKKNIKDAEYLNLDRYDKEGNVILTDEEKNLIIGKYKINNNILEINKDVIYLTIKGKQKRISYEIIDKDDDYIYLETDSEETYTYDRKGNKLCEYEYDEEEEDEGMYCYEKTNE
ncbi:MAG: hypothetical protein F083_2394 [bacterium F083]|nr:MAG: hypothetical protein F083_2394 [bacterium F083]